MQKRRFYFTSLLDRPGKGRYNWEQLKTNLTSLEQVDPLEFSWNKFVPTWSNLVQLDPQSSCRLISPGISQGEVDKIQRPFNARSMRWEARNILSRRPFCL